MQHVERAGGLTAMEVDHFDPRRKRDLWQCYENLFLATRHCNGHKSDRWPTRRQVRLGLRFLNCCLEADYGWQIFEDPNTHELIGSTPAARWHIRMCDLNGEHFVAERRQRAKLWDLLRHRLAVLQPQADYAVVGRLLQALRVEVEKMIPEIPPPPGPRPVP
jgi:hypothetical protein